MKLQSLLLASCLLLAGQVQADGAGEFTPVAGTGSPFTQVHFFPKNGNQILIRGKHETIPAGVGVIQGGVPGIYNDASIDKVEHQKLKGKTLYYVYVYMKKGKMKMDFSQTGHKEDPVYGNEVHAKDPARSLVGMVYTTAEGKFLGNNHSQLTLSWFNRGHTALVQHLDGASTESKGIAEVNESYRLEWLQWGINDRFKQGFTVPNIYVSGTVFNTKPGSYVQVNIGISNAIPVAFNADYFQAEPKTIGMVNTVVTGANGAEEGYNYASFLMCTAFSEGKAVMKEGVIYTSPLES